MDINQFQEYLKNDSEFDKAMDSQLLRSLSHVTLVKNLQENKWQINYSGDEDIRKALFNLAVSQSAAVLSMQKEESKLEDVFQQLTLIR